ncbi:hypothetical protein BGW41_000876 [Actinomortierella wolfii]|nr:hypothetical protein BGW41_000876 [Actinomortierella wolfii]
MKVVGLTGGIASGKSTVVKTVLTLGIPVIDCDILARKVVEPGQKAYKKVVAHFGTKILINETMGQPFDRPKLGSIVFNDAKERRVLNSIIHPAVRDEILKELFHYWIRATPLVVVDVPLLLEGELWRIMSTVVVVYCEPEVQLARIQSRDGLSAEDAQARINAQRPLHEKVEYADHVLYNTSDLDTLNKQTVALFNQLKPHQLWTILNLIPPIPLVTVIWALAQRHIKGDPRKMKSKKKDTNQETVSTPNGAPAHAS